MYTEKQLIKFGLYAERAHRLAFDVALSAAELGQYGRGMAVVAEEVRSIGNKLYFLFDNEKLMEAEILDATKQLKFLVLNGILEMIRLHESQLTLKKRIAVIMEEIQKIAVDIESAFGVKKELPIVVPRIIEKSTVINDTILYLLFSIGGISFCEAVENVMEVLIGYQPEQVKNNTIQIREQSFPVLNYYEKLSLIQKADKDEVILIISTEYEEKAKQYVVLIDSLPQIIYGGLGRNTQPTGIPAKLVRECWKCEEDLQMVFLDYGNFNAP